MASRDLTRIFVEKRKNRHVFSPFSLDLDKLSDTEQLLRGGTEHEKQIRKFEEDAQSIQNDADRIRQQIDRLHRIHSQMFIVTSFDEEQPLEHDIQVLSDQILAGLASLKKRIAALFPKSFNEYPKKIGNDIIYPDGESESTFIIRRNMQQSLAAHVQTLTHSFQSNESKYLQQIRSIPQNNPRTFNETSLEDDDDRFGFPSSFAQQQRDQLEQQARFAHSRMEDIQHISRTIHQISILSSDLQNLVVDQGSLLDNVQYNLETAHVEIKEGIVQLTKASKNQQRSLCLHRIILFLVAGIIITLSIILLRFFFRRR